MISSTETFGTVINCIDGRAQAPAADWLRLHCHVTYVDVITTPGADKALCDRQSERTLRLMTKARLSARRHMSSVIAVAGHYDCLANPCDFEIRREQIVEAAATVRSWKLGLRVVGLYVNEWGSVDLVCDSDTEYRTLNTYL